MLLKLVIFIIFNMLNGTLSLIVLRLYFAVTRVLLSHTIVALVKARVKKCQVMEIMTLL